MLRRLVAGLAAAVLVAEAAVLVLVHVVLGRTTANQSMSIAGSDPVVMSRVTFGLGVAIGAFLLLCAVLLAVAGLRDRPPGRFARFVLAAAAVTHALLGALSVGLVGWGAFAATMLVFCLLVLSLTLYERRPGAELRPTSP
ncbi:hypothetical protein OOK31_12925 [Streptomyces sp. NBC_00249]|uniref:hypothetical protein n=1 Tax=Streptomyces sp. NBC_00249 TaxID=2975690 RepID=UPI00225571B0|nr:hypothetical protein [Streptomyces sp. NBC_00249]MCX5194790.1 hypothetical protein [Streptomyces sp. NBC_00249]